MLHDFVILHRRKPHVFTGAERLVWSTCLRSLHFTNTRVGAEALDEVYMGAAAYQFLLEIICGLHSPIQGETEVFGQFKIFAQTWASQEPRRAGLIQRVLNDAKSLRAQHLSGLGTQSYGSWVRKNLTAKRVHILGAGHLAQEILPYMSKQADAVLHVRQPDKTTFHHAVQPIAAQAFDGGALIIAAPMTAADIAIWLGGVIPEQVFDLRDNSSEDRLMLPCSNFALQDVFAQIEQTKMRLVPIVQKIKVEIVSRSEKLASHALVRPQGWDDLCA